MVDESDRQALEWMRVHRGPFPFGDLTRNPSAFATWLLELGVGTVLIDSLKDVALGLSEDAVRARLRRSIRAHKKDGRAFGGRLRAGAQTGAHPAALRFVERNPARACRS
jgi:hypothetical protein